MKHKIKDAILMFQAYQDWREMKTPKEFNQFKTNGRPKINADLQVKN